jgi:hypothetical protein
VERLEAAGDPQLLAYAHVIAANIARLNGTLAQGLAAVGEAIRAYEELGLVLPLRESRHLEALLLTELGRLEEADQRWRDQRAEAERTGSSTGRFFARLGEAEVLARRGDLEPARAMLEHELAAADGSDDPGVIGPVMVVLAPVAGLLARGREEVVRAETLRTRLLATWGAGPVPWHETRAQLAVAEAALAVGDGEAAALHLDEAATLAERAPQPHRLAEVAQGRAVLAGGRGDDRAVLTLLAAASRLRADTGAAAWRHVVERNERLQADARARLGADEAASAWRRGERGGAAVVTGGRGPSPG